MISCNRHARSFLGEIECPLQERAGVALREGMRLGISTTAVVMLDPLDLTHVAIACLHQTLADPLAAALGLVFNAAGLLVEPEVL